MILNVYSIYDVKAAAYRFPFFKGSNGEAMRFFGDGVSDPKTALAAHPEDYNLYLHGSFDDISGQLTTLHAPQFLCAAVDFIQQAVQSGGVKDEGDNRKA